MYGYVDKSTDSTSPRRYYLDKPAIPCNWSDIGVGGGPLPDHVPIGQQPTKCGVPVTIMTPNIYHNYDKDIKTPTHRHDESGSLSPEYEKTVSEGVKYRDLYNKYCKLVEAARRVCRVYIAQNEEDSEAEAVAALLDEI